MEKRKTVITKATAMMWNVPESLSTPIIEAIENLCIAGRNVENSANLLIKYEEDASDLNAYFVWEGNGQAKAGAVVIPASLLHEATAGVYLVGTLSLYEPTHVRYYEALSEPLGVVVAANGKSHIFEVQLLGEEGVKKGIIDGFLELSPLLNENISNFNFPPEEIFPAESYPVEITAIDIAKNLVYAGGPKAYIKPKLIMLGSKRQTVLWQSLSGVPVVWSSINNGQKLLTNLLIDIQTKAPRIDIESYDTFMLSGWEAATIRSIRQNLGAMVLTPEVKSL